MDQVFPIAPASAKALYFIAFVCSVLLVVVGVLALLGYSVRHSTVTVRPDSIRLFGDLWGRTIPRSALEVERARIVDLCTEQGLKPRSRRMGTGMPGYAAGWFGLANGEKALVYLTTWNRVVYVPTREGYALLLSVEQPEQFLHAIGASTR
jgi:hypothetical protein